MKPYTDTQHPSVEISEPSPGSFVITGHRPKSVFVEGEGYIVPPSECFIPSEVPTSALLHVLEARGLEFANPEEDGASNATGPQGPIGLRALSERVVEALNSNGGTVRIGILSEMLNVTADEIKAAAGVSYEIASGGWVKIKSEGGEQ